MEYFHLRDLFLAVMRPRLQLPAWNKRMSTCIYIFSFVQFDDHYFTIQSLQLCRVLIDCALNR